MSSNGYNRSIFTYDTLVHAISGAAVSVYFTHVRNLTHITLSPCDNFDISTFQGSVVAMAAFYPLDTVRSRLQCKPYIRVYRIHDKLCIRFLRHILKQNIGKSS